eukprot:COSAG02_NODE_215_length_28614_cov_43.077047_3_plen_206_part_00
MWHPVDVGGLLLALLVQHMALADATCDNMTVHQDTRCPTPAYMWTNASSWEECSADCCETNACLAFAYDRTSSDDTPRGPCHLKHYVTALEPEVAGIVCGVLPNGLRPQPPGPAPPPSPGPAPQCPAQRPRPGPRPAPAPPSSTPKPHIFMFLQDDLGHDDVAFNGNEVNIDVTGNITAVARAGIILKRHYVHWHCSPTRRSFLT